MKEKFPEKKEVILEDIINQERQACESAIVNARKIIDRGALEEQDRQECEAAIAEVYKIMAEIDRVHVNISNKVDAKKEVNEKWLPLLEETRNRIEAALIGDSLVFGADTDKQTREEQGAMQHIMDEELLKKMEEDEFNEDTEKIRKMQQQENKNKKE